MHGDGTKPGDQCTLGIEVGCQVACRGAEGLDPVSVRADLTGASLVGASLTGAYLVGANLARTRLHGADLTGAVLTRQQVDMAVGNERTRLPAGLPRPSSWTSDGTG